MQLVLQYNDEYSTNLENDTPDIVLQVIPKGDSPPLSTRRLEELPSSSQASNSSSTSDDSSSTGIAPPILKHRPTPTTFDGTPIKTARADDAGPSSSGLANSDPPSVTTSSEARSPRRSVTFNLPLPTTFSTNDESDQSDIDSVENRTTFTQVPLMSTGGRARVATVATRDLMDISSESEAESSEPKKMELKRAETLAAARDHKNRCS